ncbi:MAG: transcription termination/antitermination factor NusG [Ruminiclostridium sp.]|nr:transcription termination/antitermination factor NusG [Ruminiclostridium sp.]
MSEAKWYILHTYSGYENKVANNIMKIVDNNNLHHLIEEVMVPTETVVEEHDGKTKTYESKLFPSYVYVKMVLTDESWYICRNTRGCTGFVGPGSKPIPLTDEEVKNLGVTTKVAEISFAVGDTIKIVSGSLEGFEGTVDSIDEENGTASVTVSMFGRPTPATVEISAVQKVEY